MAMSLSINKFRINVNSQLEFQHMTWRQSLKTRDKIPFSCWADNYPNFYISHTFHILDTEYFIVLALQSVFFLLPYFFFFESFFLVHQKLIYKDENFLNYCI